MTEAEMGKVHFHSMMCCRQAGSQVKHPRQGYTKAYVTPKVPIGGHLLKLLGQQLAGWRGRDAGVRPRAVPQPAAPRSGCEGDAAAPGPAWLGAAAARP